MPDRYFEELNVGDKFVCRGRTVTEGDLAAFCNLTWVSGVIHTDKEFMKKTQFGERLVPGVMTLALSMGIASISIEEFKGFTIANLGWQDMKFPNPVFPGDTVHTEVEITDKRETRRPDRGVITLKYTTYNQEGEVVMEAVTANLYQRRPAQA